MSVESLKKSSQPLVITQGDPAGIGPEIIAKAFRDAPEVVRGEAVPSTQTDLHALAVLIFSVLMVQHPLLIQRPIVVTPLGTRLCRPSEAVLDILPEPQRGAFNKEDGEPVIDAQGRRIQG